MQADPQPAVASKPGDSKWPASAMLGYGTFGRRTPAARRYHVRTAIALAAMTILWPVATFMAIAHPGTPWKTAGALAPGIAFTYIAWEFRRYVLALDELARRIQLEAIAWTYLTGLAVAMLMGGLAMGYGWHGNRAWLNPMGFVLLEPVRGGFLYFVARRYR